ncbi:hypothetical protein CAPTEDRAFT_186794 [Capitella teleta]|uniref:Uncharacterized protein n=1 Tax=Capitella teleta TaxID=283909 RepID=R7U9M9_CAPTE|nr:hypothetical protein CAPTEDRAFT_186794 [Capitella teleta]|eukprot:ELU03065.1 hypothetical protein CAPTEDRAFT_186794 [Capitella teleta]
MQYMGIEFLFRPQTRRSRLYEERLRLETIPDHKLKHYRLPRAMIKSLSEEYGRSSFNNVTERGHAIPPDTQVLVALRFYGKGGFQSELAAIHGVSRSSVSRIIRHVSEFLCSKATESMTLPKSRNSICVKFDSNYVYLPTMSTCKDEPLKAVLAPLWPSIFKFCSRSFDKYLKQEYNSQHNLKIKIT